MADTNSDYTKTCNEGYSGSTTGTLLCHSDGSRDSPPSQCTGMYCTLIYISVLNWSRFGVAVVKATVTSFFF